MAIRDSFGPAPSRPLHPLVGLAIALGATFAAAAIGSSVTFTALGSWYAQLDKPSFNPPNSVFGPVWTVLYILMAVAAWRAWKKGRDAGMATGAAVGLFAVQLVLNAGWSVAFFGLQAPGPAFVVIVALWLAIAATIVAFRRLDGWAAAMMVPYLAWVTFAGALNFSIWQLNGWTT